MSYEKQTWNKYDELKTEEENIENGAVVTDNRMNHMETGIGDNDANLASHLADKNNPHKVTAAQVGLDKVDNVKQASKVEFDSHVNNKANPHEVTANQVGAYTKTESDTKFSTVQSLTNLENKSISNKGNLAIGDDLNDIRATGFYRIGGFVGGTEILNVPTELSGVKFYAFVTVTEALQELTVYAPINSTTWTYSRSISGTTPTWSSWSKTIMADDSGKVTVKDLEITNTLKRKEASKTFPMGYGITATAERIGEAITLSIYGANTAGAIPQGKVMDETIPDGFRPRAQYSCQVACQGQSYAFFVLGSDGKITYGGANVPISNNFRATVPYFTNDSFPAS